MPTLRQRAICFATHVISQITYRWCPSPFPLDDVKGGDLREMSLSQWVHLLEDILDGRSIRNSRNGAISRESAAGPLDIAEMIVRELELIATSRGAIVLYCDPEYPPLLRLLADPPIALSLLGSLDALHEKTVAIVGSRRASERAWKQSYQLGIALAEEGYSIVSGGAYGCDIAAHLGVLQANVVEKRSVVVQAGGLGCLYPSPHIKVFRRLQDSGGVVCSERLWSTAALPFSFPVRNRIIAGLSAEVLIMQASRKSGAMTTARLALDAGRELSVLSHDPWDVRAEGSQSLIDAGASCFKDSQQYLDRLHG